MSVLPRAIVLGVDTPIGLTVVRELGRHGVPVHAIGRKSGAIGGASRYCESFSIREAGFLRASEKQARRRCLRSAKAI
jgi:NAD(P)-dependent dehydrogenase (short-subunit alcohol dehydrogenase family)